MQIWKKEASIFSRFAPQSGKTCPEAVFSALIFPVGRLILESLS